MAVKNSNYGVLNQRFHCYNCGGNSIILDYSLLEYSLDKRDDEQENVSSAQKTIDYLVATCKHCGWVDC